MTGRGDEAPAQSSAATVTDCALWASLIELIDETLPGGKQQRFCPPLFYKAPVDKDGFTDITSGNNASVPDPGVGYNAGQGFDAVTGWGAPNGKRLLEALGKV